MQKGSKFLNVLSCKSVLLNSEELKFYRSWLDPAVLLDCRGLQGKKFFTGTFGNSAGVV